MKENTVEEIAALQVLYELTIFVSIILNGSINKMAFFDLDSGSLVIRQALIESDEALNRLFDLVKHQKGQKGFTLRHQEVLDVVYRTSFLHLIKPEVHEERIRAFMNHLKAVSKIVPDEAFADRLKTMAGLLQDRLDEIKHSELPSLVDSDNYIRKALVALTESRKPLTTSEIEKQINVGTSSAVSALNYLETAGLITRAVTGPEPRYKATVIGAHKVKTVLVRA